jgi:hypothetical protein
MDNYKRSYWLLLQRMDLDDRFFSRLTLVTFESDGRQQALK